MARIRSKQEGNFMKKRVIHLPKHYGERNTIRIEKLTEHDRKELLAMIDLTLTKCNNALQRFAH